MMIRTLLDRHDEVMHKATIESSKMYDVADLVHRVGVTKVVLHYEDGSRVEYRRAE